MINLKEKLKFLFGIETVVIGAVLFVYGFILYYIQRGISCDEGYYLIGYLKNQELGPMISDFHSIIRSITPIGMQDNVMYFRYLRFGLDFISVLSFGLASFYWLKNRIKTFKIRSVLYVSLILLSGVISYTYTTATISFDHLQHIIYLFAFSAFIAADLTKNNIVRIVGFLITGMLVVLAITNYLPSGLLLFAVFVTLIIVLHTNKSAIYKITFLCGGILIGFILYHSLINSVNVFFENVTTSIKIASDGVTRHDSSNLLTKMLSAISVFLLIQTPFLIAGHFFGRINLHYKIIAIVIVLIICALLFIRNIYLLQGYLYYTPVSFMLGIWSVNIKSLKKDINLSYFLVFLIFSFLPFMGIFGTNQAIMAKIMIFLPFWMCLFLFVIENIKISKKLYGLLILFVIVLFSFGYLYQGNFRRYHSYYTPRTSKYEINCGLRYKNIKVSQYEKEYYRIFTDTLKSIGFKAGNTALAFGEQQIGLYLSGGYFHGRLVYSINQYVKIPAQRADYIFLFKKEEEDMKKQLKNSDWNFPEDYTRIELGRMAENLDAANYKTVIYYHKHF